MGEHDGLDRGPARVEAAAHGTDPDGFTTAALLLAVVAGLQLGGVIAQGLAIADSGPQGLSGDVLHRIGFAFLENVGPLNGIVLLAVVALAAAPDLLALPLRPGGRTRQGLAFALSIGFAAVVVVGAILATRAQLRVIDLRGAEVTSLTVRVLFTYLVGTVGTALVTILIAFRHVGPGPSR